MLLISGTYERRKKACHCLITELVSVLGGIKARKMYVDKQRLEAQVFTYGLLLCSMYMVSMRIPINEDPMIL